MNLFLSPERFAVCQLPSDASIPTGVPARANFLSITRTSEELSIVCLESSAPAGVKQEPGWRMFKVEGPLDFGLTGVLADIARPLAEASISIFSIATFNTDYVLVKDAQVTEAVTALQAAGHTVSIE